MKPSNLFLVVIAAFGITGFLACGEDTVAPAEVVSVPSPPVVVNHCLPDEPPPDVPVEEPPAEEPNPPDDHNDCDDDQDRVCHRHKKKECYWYYDGHKKHKGGGWERKCKMVVYWHCR